MMPKITQKNVHIFIPFKIAKICTQIESKESLSPKDALLQIYKSDMYKNLSNEKTKSWQQGWVSLYKEMTDNCFKDN